jgi:hypothetical protein
MADKAGTHMTTTVRRLDTALRSDTDQQCRDPRAQEKHPLRDLCLSCRSRMPGRIGGTTAKLGMIMQNFGSRELTSPRVAWDAWRATHSGPAAVAPRQAARLEALVMHARLASRFYAERYREMPPGRSVPKGSTSCPRLPNRS